MTGSKRLPIGGFKNLNPNIAIVRKQELPGEDKDTKLPSVMSCQNYFKCPNYSSYEVFKQKFDYSIDNG
jgi:E3 ubiquitin-protein ligase TRIP12